MFDVLDDVALTRISGGGEFSVRNCKGGAEVMRNDKGELYALLPNMFPHRIAPGLTPEQYCGEVASEAAQTPGK